MILTSKLEFVSPVITSSSKLMNGSIREEYSLPDELGISKSLEESDSSSQIVLKVCLGIVLLSWEDTRVPARLPEASVLPDLRCMYWSVCFCKFSKQSC